MASIAAMLGSQPSGAIFSPCYRYRYGLWRCWNPAQPFGLFIGLNPSTADASTNDPTIRRCIGFAQSWGWGGLVVTNIFAYRTTYPKELRQTKDPIGPETDKWIVDLCQALTAPGGLNQNTQAALSETTAPVIAIWGNAGVWWERDRAILQLIQPIVPQVYCLAITKQGQPAHPLYLSKHLQPRPYPSATVATE